MPTPELVPEPVPLWQQLVAAITGIASFCAMVLNGLRRKKDFAPAHHVVMDTASLTDTRPFKELLKTLIASNDRGNRAIEAMHQTIQEWIREEREARREREREENNEARMQMKMDALIGRIKEKEK